MGKPGVLNIIIGVVIMIGTYFLKTTLAGWDLGFLYYVGEVIGLVIFGLGLKTFLGERGKSDADREAEHTTLRNEVLLKTLARMTYADTNTTPVEIAAVKKIYKKATGEDISEPEIRVTARGDLHEPKAFKKYLADVRDKISMEDKCFIIKAMAEVVKVDGAISPGEVDFFDEVGKAFKLNPSEIADLKK